MGIALGHPAFVTKIDKQTNTVYIGEREELEKTDMIVRKTSIMKYDNIIGSPIHGITKVRYNDHGTAGIIEQCADGRVLVHFDNFVPSIAPGQSAVFYEGNDVIGGGWIESAS